jgi:hypothetical protein
LKVFLQVVLKVVSKVFELVEGLDVVGVDNLVGSKDIADVVAN